MKNLNDVHDFWDKNPLWTGESVFELGSMAFFEDHRNVCIEDCFAGEFDLRFLPPPRARGQKMQILDLGCGIGFWLTEFSLRGLTGLHAADLTPRAIEVKKKRLQAYGGNAELSLQNAEALTFDGESFDHVSCQGVIHHTPDTKKALYEIARVLKPGGFASVFVYYRNGILKTGPLNRFFALPWARLKGRGRENIFFEKDVDQIVRLYDGSDNPIGKSSTKQQFIELLELHFRIQETCLHFFPTRLLHFKLPKFLHRWLDKNLGFMIYASLLKK